MEKYIIEIYEADLHKYNGNDYNLAMRTTKTHTIFGDYTYTCTKKHLLWGTVIHERT